MDNFHNLLRDAAASASAASNASAPNNLLNAAAMGLPPQLSGTPGLSLPVSLPMPMASAMTSLAPIHRMNANGASAAPTPGFPSLTNGAIPGLAAAPAPAPADKPAKASSVASSTASSSGKKRKASDVSKDAREPEEYEDPKAKRRAQIARAARKHRQRQKDELISLRAKVKDLKEQIEVLQSSEPSEHNTELGWKQEAEQHAEIRARVDQENEFLRKTLMEQMKFIQRLQDYFTKQPLLNMPSLDLILNSSSATSTPAIASSIMTAPPTLELPSSSFPDQLRRLANDAMSGADKALMDCETAFRTPKNPTMTYFGLEVQYEMNDAEMGIFFRHHIYNCDAHAVVNDLWACMGNAAFEKKFPFVDSIDVLEELDEHTKYTRRVVTLSTGNDGTQPNGTIKEERLEVNQKRENPDGSLYYISRTVKNDPQRPKAVDHVRRNHTTTVSLRNFNDANGNGCLLLWSAKVIVDKNSDDGDNAANVPDVILKNLFEVTPLFVKAIVDRARGITQP